MNIRIDTLKTAFDWQTVRIAVDGPIWDLRPVWKQADEIIITNNFITIVAYEQATPVGYILYNITKKETMLGVSKVIPEESRNKIETALRAELEKNLQAQKK